MSQGELGLRPLALLAKHEQDLAWVRERKETWGNNSPWDRRAIIWASTALPRDERNPWLRLVEQNGDHLDRAVAQLAGIEP